MKLKIFSPRKYENFQIWALRMVSIFIIFIYFRLSFSLPETWEFIIQKWQDSSVEALAELFIMISPCIFGVILPHFVIYDIERRGGFYILKNIYGLRVRCAKKNITTKGQIRFFGLLCGSALLCKKIQMPFCIVIGKANNDELQHRLE